VLSHQYLYIALNRNINIDDSDEQEIVNYKKILNTEHKFVALYVINSTRNIFMYCSAEHFTLKKLNLLGLIILPGPDNTG